MRIKRSKVEVLQIIESGGRSGIRIHGIVMQTGWKVRTVQAALRVLRTEGLIRRIPDLLDMRCAVYYGGE